MGQQWKNTNEQDTEPTNAQLIQGGTLPSPICNWDSTQHHPLDPKWNGVTRDFCKTEPKTKVYQLER